jgi:S1-C subfamily serine protease
MVEEPEAALGSNELGGEPVFPTTPQPGPASWADLSSDPAWPPPGTSAGADPTVPFVPGPSGSGGPAKWPAGAPSHPSPDDTWHDDTWRGDLLSPAGPAPAAPAPPGREHGRRPWAWAAVLAVTVLVAGGAGAGIALAVSNNSSSNPSKSTALPQGGRTPPLSSNSQALNVHLIASHVVPATVDITAKGSNGQDEGTGMILTSAGVVLTNNHVIDGSTQVTAEIDGKGQTYRVAVLGTDAVNDVALLQLKGGGSNFKTVSLGDSAAITVGDPVVAIGNALGLSGPETVTNGIISATGRSITVGDPNSGLTENLKDMFQSSAAINPGNSGGPLVDSGGRVIGINTAEASGSGSGQSASNVGFAIPINSAMAIARQIQDGRASATIQIGPHAIIGVEVTSVACADGGDGCTSLGNSSPFGLPIGGSSYAAPVKKGAVVAGVEQGDPAQTAGLATGDVITSVNRERINSPSDLTNYMNLQKVGERATVHWVDPKGQRRSATVNFVQGPNV